MKIPRPWLLAAGALVTAFLAYVARDAVHDFLVLPIAYGAWQLRGLLAGVAELVQWALVVVVMALVMAWQLIPRLGPGGQRRPRPITLDGPVNATAIALWRARSSNYFRWQLAHRLGQVARQLSNLTGRPFRGGNAPAAIADYLNAGLNQSFVDYASPRSLLRRPSAGPLAVDPEAVVRYLEMHMTPDSESHDKSS